MVKEIKNTCYPTHFFFFPAFDANNIIANHMDSPSYPVILVA